MTASRTTSPADAAAIAALLGAVGMLAAPAQRPPACPAGR